MDLIPELKLSVDACRDEAGAILRDALGRAPRPSRVVALFSGGHDSLCAAHVVASVLGGPVECVHVDTGIGVPATREFVRETCRRFGWPLTVLTPPPFAPARQKRKSGIDYDNLPAYEAVVLHYGFPGAYGHTLVYNRLKERCLRQLERDIEASPRRPVLYVTGVRKQESRRRMGHIVALQREGRRTWCAPLTNWSRDERDAYHAAEVLPRNPVVARLCMSGECLCGAYGSPGELAEIAFHYPEVAAYIRSLEARARAAGAPHCVWGEKTKAGRRRRDGKGPRLGLCWSCVAKAEAITEVRDVVVA